MKNGESKLFINKKLIVVVVLFIAAASLLVVLTNFSINMIATSRDYTALLAEWGQLHSRSQLIIERYSRNGNPADYEVYLRIKTDQVQIEEVINELFKASANTSLIFETFNSESKNLHPSEVSALVIAFYRFHDMQAIKKIKSKWQQLQQVEDREERLIANIQEAWQTDVSGTIASSVNLMALSKLNKQCAVRYKQMMAAVGDASFIVKQIGLWLSVILGILLVLIGVVVSVRANKSISGWKQMLKERNYLARFPQLNPNPVLQIDLDGSLTYMNKAARGLFPSLPARGIDHLFLTPVKKLISRTEIPDFGSQVSEVQIGDTYYQQLIHYVSPKQGVHVYTQDITQNKRQQEQISASLREKEVLLAEIHHRVKNNLAVITGLLELESMSSGNPEKALQESRDRIKSMAIIHEILYQSNSFSRINLRDYMQQLTNYISDTYDQKKQIRVETDFESVSLNINQAVPVGLILNELLANAMEHGFGVTDCGKIEVVLRQKGSCVKLALKDNGKGLPAGFDYESSATVGMSIIKALVQQLSGKCTSVMARG